MRSNPRTAVLVAERDGEWDAWIDSLRDQADDVAIVVQRRDESATAFATRVRARVLGLREGGDVCAAALVGGSAWDAETLSARSLMVRAIVSQMVGAGGGTVYLDGGGRVGRGRHAMQALAAVVEDQVAQTGVEIVTAPGGAPARALERAA